ncbi:MAG: WD40 repeat protein [Bacteroidia bacterium]|jgi:WD40 repeat protein
MPFNIVKLEQYAGHKDSVYAFEIDHKRNVIYSAGADGCVIAWSLNKKAQGKMILQTSEALYSIALFGNVLRVGSKSGRIYDISLTEKKLLKDVVLHRGGVFALGNGYSGGEDGIFRYDDVDYQISSLSVRCTELTSNGLAIGCSDHNIHLFNETEKRVSHVLKGHTNSVFAMCSIDEQTLLSAGRDGAIKAWDLSLMKEVFSVSAHMYQVKSLAWNGAQLLSCSMDKTIKIWNEALDLQKVIDIDRYASHTNCINKVAWINEREFISCSDDRSLIRWKLEPT